jgi:hypothetical protein
VVEQSKQWAVGMDKANFEVEFQKRYPFAGGVIPDMNKWLKVVPKESTTIEPFNEEEVSIEHFTKKPRIEKTEDENGFKGFTVNCAGCEQQYIKNTEKKANAALRAHERHCKGLLKKR